jgi:mono/diheme cytochrome c family protein
MVKLLVVVSTILLAVMSATIQEPRSTSEAAVPQAAPTQPIPPKIKPSAESLARAKKMYGYDCAMCHAADGAGNGELAGQMKLTLSDMRDPAALKDMTDAQIYGTIRDGKDKMPAEGSRMDAEAGWSMVVYVRSLSAGKDKAPVGDQPKK